MHCFTIGHKQYERQSGIYVNGVMRFPLAKLSNIQRMHITQIRNYIYLSRN